LSRIGYLHKFLLSISKRIVEAHGVSASPESTGGKGSAFTVRVPIRLDLEEVKAT